MNIMYIHEIIKQFFCLHIQRTQKINKRKTYETTMEKIHLEKFIDWLCKCSINYCISRKKNWSIDQTLTLFHSIEKHSLWKWIMTLRSDFLKMFTGLHKVQHSLLKGSNFILLMATDFAQKRMKGTRKATIMEFVWLLNGELTIMGFRLILSKLTILIIWNMYCSNVIGLTSDQARVIRLMSLGLSFWISNIWVILVIDKLMNHSY